MDVTARTIAEIVRNPSTSIKDATCLIQNFADAEASGAAVKATEQAYARAMAIIDSTSLMPTKVSA